VFANPDKLDITRDNARRHLAFGYGIHRCVGARLAELQLKVLLEEMHKRRMRVHVAGDVERVRANFVHGFRKLEVEITEGALLEHTEEIIEKLNDLRTLGLSLAIDDFGTGFSSLAYLRNLPISVIKIDQSFVRGMLSNDNDRVLVETIISMAHNLGLKLVAEGVETAEQRDRLAELGCEIGQGYLFGRPVPAEEFAQAYLG
jgi:EAL domain-containing protein (putative c-di-GMP-specific phosphodiesterase class I)